MSYFQAHESAWREAARMVPADFRGLRAFRQFKLSTSVDVTSWEVQPTEFVDDFTLRAVIQDENWRPRDNVAVCMMKHARPHPVPSRDCSCGYYASYSSSIIYKPDRLKYMLYCFAAVRMYGENLPLAQNGLRSSGAEVEGILFRPESLTIPSVKNFIKRLEQEEIFYTDSAIAFLEQFPDQDYSGIVGFDPVRRLNESGYLLREARSLTDPNDWLNSDYSYRFYRPIRSCMVQRQDLPNESIVGMNDYAISLKPEYRVGGALYLHPLIEAWGY